MRSYRASEAVQTVARLRENMRPTASQSNRPPPGWSSLLRRAPAPRPCPGVPAHKRALASCPRTRPTSASLDIEVRSDRLDVFDERLRRVARSSSRASVAGAASATSTLVDSTMRYFVDRSDSDSCPSEGRYRGRHADTERAFRQGCPIFPSRFRFRRRHLETQHRTDQ